LISESPVAAASHIVDETSIGSLTTDLTTVLTTDGYADTRAQVRNLYFDSIEPGESTTRFWQELQRSIHEHDQALGSLSRVRTIARDSV
jgi:hypothetical protein